MRDEKEQGVQLLEKFRAAGQKRLISHEEAMQVATIYVDRAGTPKHEDYLLDFYRTFLGQDEGRDDLQGLRKDACIYVDMFSCGQLSTARTIIYAAWYQDHVCFGEELAKVAHNTISRKRLYELLADYYGIRLLISVNGECETYGDSKRDLRLQM